MPGAGEDAIDLISKMLEFNPKRRIDIDGVVSHPYLEKTRVEEARKNLSYLEALRKLDLVEKIKNGD